MVNVNEVKVKMSFPSPNGGGEEVLQCPCDPGRFGDNVADAR